MDELNFTQIFLEFLPMELSSEPVSQQHEKSVFTICFGDQQASALGLLAMASPIFSPFLCASQLTWPPFPFVSVVAADAGHPLAQMCCSNLPWGEDLGVH